MKPTQTFTRRSFLRTLSAAVLAVPFVTQGAKSRSPNSVLGHASFGAGGMAWADLNELGKFKQQLELVAVADVDLGQTVELRKKFPSVRVYQDWRDLLDEEGPRIDTVNVSTPDHMHAIIAMSAMQLGKHVYCQKPLAHDLYEVRKLTMAAREKGLITQMGIQINSSVHYRTATLLTRAGAIGKIKEVHSWCPKSWGDTAAQPERTDPVPEGLDWNLWLGVCEKRPFIGGQYYHPANWRKRLDFGTGTFGDMGCHIFDPVFSSLKLGAPVSVRSEGPAPNKWNWALDSKIIYRFPGTPFTAGPTIEVIWYDGAARPPKEVLALLEGDQPPDTGSILVGTGGVMVIPHVARPMLYPDKKFQALKYPEIGSSDHWGKFIEGCVTGCGTTANFDYAGPLTEAVLLGGVASRFPQTTLKWDSAALQFDLPEANQYVRRSYSSGWNAMGL
jgi:predicted dehydrogenase